MTYLEIVWHSLWTARQQKLEQLERSGGEKKVTTWKGWKLEILRPEMRAINVCFVMLESPKPMHDGINQQKLVLSVALSWHFCAEDKILFHYVFITI